MKKFDRNLVPSWRPGYRFQFEPAQNANVLLYPEGMIKLNESAGWIGSLIDGQRTVAAIIGELQSRLPKFPELGADVDEFMQHARQENWIALD